MVETRAGCLVVADVDGSFQGVVTTARMLPLLLAEHDEDLARIGGYLAGSSRARRAAREPVGRRLWHRLPWLIVGLLGAMVSALIMGAFETTLESNVLIALFVPAIVYMAGAVGAQTQTVLIRAFAVGVTTRQILFRELVTGALTGVIIGAIFLGFSYLVWGDIEVAIAVSIALLASATVAVAVAIALPALFQKMGLDPAFGSGPLATLIQDLLSITTYFVAVVLIVT
jgi:magnesium transporter